MSRPAGIHRDPAYRAYSAQPKPLLAAFAYADSALQGTPSGFSCYRLYAAIWGARPLSFAAG